MEAGFPRKCGCRGRRIMPLNTLHTPHRRSKPASHPSYTFIRLLFSLSPYVVRRISHHGLSPNKDLSPLTSRSK